MGVTFETSPKNNPNLTVDGAMINAPKALAPWEGYALDVNAPTHMIVRIIYNFVSLTDGDAAWHTLTTPASARIYTAMFRK